jgi:hypothetical protein
MSGLDAQFYTYCERCGCSCLDVVTESVARIDFKYGESHGQVRDILTSCDFGGTADAQCCRCGMRGAVRTFRHAEPFPSSVALCMTETATRGTAPGGDVVRDRTRVRSYAEVV